MSSSERTPSPGDQDWAGFREVDRAIAEDRLIAYSWRKTWADPWGRRKMLLTAFIFVAFVIFVFVDELVL